jgi:hypothetical protein
MINEDVFDMIECQAEEAHRQKVQHILSLRGRRLHGSTRIHATPVSAECLDARDEHKRNMSREYYRKNAARIIEYNKERYRRIKNAGD